MYVCQHQWLMARVSGFYHRVIGSIPAQKIVRMQETNDLNIFLQLPMCCI